MFLGDRETRSRWQILVEKMLNHVNPYTKLAWKDDPAIICVNWCNEQKIIKYCDVSKVLPEIRDLLNRSWRAWLRKKYQTGAAVAGVWGTQGLSGGKTLDNLEFPGSRYGSIPEANDFSLFFYELMRAETAWYEGVVRKAGYPGLISQCDLSGETIDSAFRREMSELVCMHAYFAHLTDFGVVGSRITQASSVGQLAAYWRNSNATRLCDRPLLETEHNHMFSNQYQHEAGLVFAAYSVLQGFAGLCVHENPVALAVRKDAGMDWIASNPIGRANAFITALLFRRGDVQKAAHRVERQIPLDYVRTNNNGSTAVNTEQNKISLMTGFTVNFPELKRPANLTSDVPKPDVAILPDSGGTIAGGDWAVGVVDSRNTKFSLQNFVSDLKVKGILSASNRSDPDACVFQIDTGEITMRPKENLIKVVTHRTEGVSLEANKAEALSWSCRCGRSGIGVRGRGHFRVRRHPPGHGWHGVGRAAATIL